MVENNEKVSTELTLALNLNENERKRTLDLDVGYNDISDEWELIVKYIGSISDLSEEIGFKYTELYSNFAIVYIKNDRVNALIEEPQIVYIEKTSKVYASQNVPSGFRASCMETPAMPPYSLTGKGMVVAIIDSGIDYRHESFIQDGSTRLLGIWDQTAEGTPPFNYNMGAFFDEESINASIKKNDSISYDYSGHGTAVAGIISRCVPDSKLLIVKLDNQNSSGEPNTGALIQAIDFCVRWSAEYRLPMVINLSYGNNYGDHASNSILEEYIDSVANLSRFTIVTGMGNEGATGRHIQLTLENKSWDKAEFLVNQYENSLNIQIWKSYSDIADIFLILPNGKEIGPFNNYTEYMSFEVDNESIYVLNGKPNIYNKNSETYINISSNNGYILPGVWSIRFITKRIIDGRVNLWLPVAAATSADVYFLNATEFTTMTIPSTAEKVISVAGYNEATLAYAAFSGRGYSSDERIKPDIAAPAVNIETAYVGGGYTYVSGTSFAAPFVSSGAAMLMQWGITDGNDVFLYGEKVKAYLISGAKKLPGFNTWPNPYLGYGALCVKDSIPI